MPDLADILADIGYVLLLSNLVLFAKGFLSNGKAYKIFTIYSGIIFIIQILANILNHFSINNLYLSHFYFIIQFVFLSGFYREILIEKAQKTTVKIGLVLGLLALAIQYAIQPGLFFKFNLFEIFLTSFLIIIYATFHFYNLLNDRKEFYYLNMGILIYLFGSTALFLAGNLIASLSSRQNTLTWTCNAFLYIIYQLFIFAEWKISFFRKPKAHEC